MSRRPGPHYVKPFFQVRGENPTIYPPDKYQTDIALARDIIGIIMAEARSRTGNDDYVTAFLGVQDDGSSSVLLSEAQKDKLLNELEGYEIRGRKRYTDQFASLSPIELDKLEDLTNVFREYKVKAGKRICRANEASGSKEYGRGIILYERSRVFIRHVRKIIPNPLDFSIGVESSFLQSIPIYSVAATPWSGDSRTRALREREPKITDAAWKLCQWSTNTDKVDHVTFHRYDSLKNRASADKYKEVPANVPTSTPSQIASDFKKILETSAPCVVLLIFGPITRNWLGLLPGIENRHWQDGITELLNPQAAAIPEYRSRPRREMSPSRGGSSDTKNSRDYRQPATPADGPKVYVIDVQDMFMRMANATPPAHIRDMLGSLAETQEDYARSRQPSNSQDDCQMLFDAWKIMSEGPMHIQQRIVISNRNQFERFKVKNDGEGRAEQRGPIDENEDPDDGRPTTTAAASFAPFDDDRDDYGSDMD